MFPSQLYSDGYPTQSSTTAEKTMLSAYNATAIEQYHTVNPPYKTQQCVIREYRILRGWDQLTNGHMTAKVDEATHPGLTDSGR